MGGTCGNVPHCGPPPRGKQGCAARGDSWLAVSLANTGVTDANLECLRALTSLRELELDSTQVTDVGLVHWRGLESLEGLSLDDTEKADAGPKHLKGLTSLRGLTICGTIKRTLDR